MDKKTKKIICTSFANGKCHDFRLFKESKVHVHPKATIKVDTSYLSIAKFHANSVFPKKRSKKHPLSKDDKRFNPAVSSDRVSNEHAIRFIKRFKIVSDRYRNRRKRHPSL